MNKYDKNLKKIHTLCLTELREKKVFQLKLLRCSLLTWFITERMQVILA